MITQAYLLLQNKNSLNTQKDIRFTIELAELKDLDYQSVKERQKIEFIGYEVSNGQLKVKISIILFLTVIVAKNCRKELERLHSENKPFYFIIRPTSVSDEHDELIDWHSEQDDNEVRLVIKYIARSKKILPAPTE